MSILQRSRSAEDRNFLQTIHPAAVSAHVGTSSAQSFESGCDRDRARLPGEGIAALLLDRLLHHPIVIEVVVSNSYRLREHAKLVPDSLRLLPVFVATDTVRAVSSRWSPKPIAWGPCSMSTRRGSR